MLFFSRTRNHHSNHIVNNSVKDMFERPSKAKNSGTDSRNSNYFATKVDNKINGLMEYTDKCNQRYDPD